MKREYKNPVVKRIDYVYDEQVVAVSGSTPDVDYHGDPGKLFHTCRYSTDTCTWYYNDVNGVCVTNVIPMSL